MPPPLKGNRFDKVCTVSVVPVYTLSATADPTEALAATQAAPLFIPAPAAESMARARARGGR